MSDIVKEQMQRMQQTLPGLSDEQAVFLAGYAMAAADQAEHRKDKEEGEKSEKVD